MEKLNNTGLIPKLHLINFSGDGKPPRTVYYKEARLMMGIFQGLGISQSVLEQNTACEEIVIVFKGETARDDQYSGTYVVKMDDFRKSPKKFANGYNDVQRFVSFKDMRKIGA